MQPKLTQIIEEVGDFKTENNIKIPVRFTKTTAIQNRDGQLLPSTSLLIQHLGEFPQPTAVTIKIVMPSIPK